ncbi:hypothetical protein MXD62_23670 [Frankia sp. Mgl5]|uniref:hypothetical protein n=1 Tax=Frankiaceae TaxID=74712 RepID=UPI0000544D49|nr:hypothetical protein [Frankia sp. Mgl5]ABW10235.1 hypothetical protein Franean1_0777 [Frankia sp. EAN1pec]MCK9930127.1 hypothetical protein [Frankia sp. Mgl5]
MRSSALGLIAGLVAGLALAFGGFGEFLIVLLFGALGLIVGKLVDGEIDLSRFDRGRFDQSRPGRDRGRFPGGGRRREQP